MNRLSVILCMVLAATISLADGVGVASPQKPYDPTQVYTGSYGPFVVYYRETFRAKWRLGLTGAFPKAVNCPDALSHLKITGLWRGHLKLNGSCGNPDEPAEWAVGNRLNYGAVTSGGH